MKPQYIELTISISNLTEKFRPLNEMQQGMLYHSLLAENQACNYLTQTRLSFFEIINIDYLCKAWECLITEYNLLRANLHNIYNINAQLEFQQKCNIKIHVYDFSQLNEEKQIHKLEEFAKQDLQTALDLTQAPLMRISLIKLNEQHLIQFWTHHHILFDSSAALLIKELLAAYDLKIQGKMWKASYNTNDTPTENKLVAHKHTKKTASEYWKNLLSNSNRSYLTSEDNYQQEISELVDEFTREETLKLQGFAKQNASTLYTLLLASWGLLLMRYTDSDDVLFGTTRSYPASIRNTDTLGLFINTLPVRAIMFDTVQTYLSFLRRQQKRSAEYFFTPLSEIKNYILNTKASSHLFETVLEFKPVSAKLLAIGNSSTRDFSFTSNTNYNLLLESSLENNKLIFKINYKLNIFSESFVSQLILHWKTILLNLCTYQGDLRTLPFMTKEELHTILYSWNETPYSYYNEQNIFQHFKMVVETKPNNIALIHDSAEITYKELYNIVINLIKQLKKYHLQYELVAIYLDKSISLIALMLAILGLTGIFWNISSTINLEQLPKLLKNNKAKLLVSTKKLGIENLNAASLIEERLLFIEDLLEPAKEPLDAQKIFSTSLNNIIYAITTSGSTGYPKLTFIKENSLLNLLYWHNQQYKVDDKVKASSIADVGFDAFIWEIFPYLIKGATIFLINKNLVVSIENLCSYLEQKTIDIAFMPTALFAKSAASLSKRKLSLKYLLIGGEALDCKIYDFSIYNFAIVNHYGLTETTIVNTCKTLNYLSSKKNIIGKPIANTKVYVLDKNQQPVPCEVTGELYIGGIGIAVGYLNQHLLNQDLFLVNGFVTDPEQRLFRSGDLVRWTFDGELEFVGRKDTQIKLYGYRIELQAIETILLQHPAIQQAHVVLESSDPEDKYLLAYIVKDSCQDLNHYNLLNYLNSHLPIYMIPRNFISLIEFPLTANGKLDKSRLPSPSTDNVLLIKYENPTNASLEQQLITIFADALQQKNIDKKRNFFELGVSSFLLIKICHEINTKLSYKIDPTLLFSYTSIEALANYLKNIHQPSTTNSLSEFQTRHALQKEKRFQRYQKSKKL